MIRNHNFTHDVTACFCPNCGCNLRVSDGLTYGNIVIDERGSLWFEGQTLHLARCQHLIVEALVRSKGRGLTRSFLATIIGGEIYDQTISKYIQRARDSFRQIEPGFDQITSLRGFGAYRWECRSSQ